MRTKVFLAGIIALLFAGNFSAASAQVEIDTTAPVVAYVDPTPSSGTSIADNKPLFVIEADEALSGAEIAFDLLNGNFENGDLGYFESDGYYWEISTSDQKNGLYSAKSSSYLDGSVYYNYSSLTRKIVLDSDSVLSFWWKVSTDESTDDFSFFINGELQDAIIGSKEWTEQNYELSAGTYNLVWKYKKNVVDLSMKNFAQVDEVHIHPYAMTIGESLNVANYQAQGPSEGLHRFFVNTKDVFGNQATSEVRTITIDTISPSGNISVSPIYQNNEVMGNINISVSLSDENSLVKDVCLWLGDGEDNLLPDDFDNCKELSEKSVYSWPYAPDFGFELLDTKIIEDGNYNMYAIVNDNAGNQSVLSRAIKINNKGRGSSMNPSEIVTCEDLQAVNENLHWHYKLMNDIDCLETKTWNSGHGFLGIGNSGVDFSGVLDGQNYHVYSIYQNVPEYNSGIINSMSGIVKNLNFRDVDIICNSTYCGGFSNINWGTIEKSSITGKLQCSEKCGGFSSQQSGLITECWADMNIGNNGFPGGFAGQIYGGTVINSYFKGIITADNGGGIVGLSEGSVVNSYSSAKINNSGFNGGLIGWQYTGTQSGSYWNRDVSGIEVMCGTNGANCLNESGLTDEEMKKTDRFVGWDFEGVWAIDSNKNEGYPYLRWQTSFTENDKVAPVITLNGPIAVDTSLGESYLDLGASAHDNIDGDLSGLIIVTSSVDINMTGVYTVSYNVRDKAGNIANEVTRTVTVKEKNKEEAKPSNSSSGSGGGGIVYLRKESIPTVFQSYNPNTGVLTLGKAEEEIKVLGIEAEFTALSEAELVLESGHGKAGLLASVSGQENLEIESKLKNKYKKLLFSESEVLSSEEEASLLNFISYGTKSTLRLGQGERAGVLASYKRAFGSLPRSVADWEDLIKIANGRWPRQIDQINELAAEEDFSKIYLRSADRANAHDDAAIVIIAYGLRPAFRNLNSEHMAIGIFKNIFNAYPFSTSDWDMVRAIAYSGAVR